MLLLSVMSPVSSANASNASLAAIGGACSASIQHEAVPFFFDKYRVRASCTSLNANTKARGIADYTGDFDTYTQWFTRLNTSYYGPWDHAIQTPKARPEFGYR